jgi:hypothetical protein
MITANRFENPHAASAGLGETAPDRPVLLPGDEGRPAGCAIAEVTCLQAAAIVL